MSRGLAYQAKKDNARAIADFSEAIRLAPMFLDARGRRAAVYETVKDYGGAIADYTEIIRLDAKNPDGHNGRCWDLALVGRDLRQALADCDESLRLRPHHAPTLNSRGLVQLKLGAWDQAISDYGEAIAQNSNDADSLYGRGIAKLRRGDTAGGAADIAAAKAVKPDIADDYAGYGIR
jgi:tetratricopeptide (TPR) repeat protein